MFHFLPLFLVCVEKLNALCINNTKGSHVSQTNWCLFQCPFRQDFFDIEHVMVLL